MSLILLARIFRLFIESIKFTKRKKRLCQSGFSLLSFIRIPGGAYKILTKGDNNEVHDRGLYNRGQKWLTNGDIVGRVKA